MFIGRGDNRDQLEGGMPRDLSDRCCRDCSICLMIQLYLSMKCYEVLRRCLSRDCARKARASVCRFLGGPFTLSAAVRRFHFLLQQPQEIAIINKCSKQKRCTQR